MSKPTPGPWIVDGPANGCPWTVHARRPWAEMEKSPSNLIVATCEDIDGTTETRTANARLISLAPDLLYLLQGLLAICEAVDDEIDAIEQMVLDKARVIILKATGTA